MRICYFGNYDSEYSRTKVLRSGLEAAGAEIIDCHSDHKGLGIYFDLRRKLKTMPAHDFIFIGNSGPSLFLPFFAQLITRKPIIWEPLYSIYDNWVFDRKVAPRFSLKALYYFIMDWVSARSSDMTVSDLLNMRAVVDEQSVWFFKPGKPDALAKRIQTVLKSKTETGHIIDGASSMATEYI